MKLIMIAAFVALAVAEERPVEVLRDDRVAPEAGGYSTNLELGNGIVISESGSAGSLGQTNVEGSYSFPDENGNEIVVHYTAGENGFVATGPHLPVAPQAPPHVERLLAIAAQQEKDGIEFN